MPSLRWVTLKFINKPIGHPDFHGLDLYDDGVLDNHTGLKDRFECDAAILERESRGNRNLQTGFAQFDHQALRVHRLEEAGTKSLVHPDSAADDPFGQSIVFSWALQHSMANRNQRTMRGVLHLPARSHQSLDTVSETADLQ
jgi:hypothetical protein